MRWLSPSHTPFIPAKYYASLLPSVPSISPPSAPLPRSIPSFFPHEIAHLPPENEIFFAPCNSLVYGEMNTTQRVLLGNILR